MKYLFSAFCTIAVFTVVALASDPPSNPASKSASNSSSNAALMPLDQVKQWHHAYAAAAQDYFFHGVFRALVAVVFTNALPFDRRDDPKHSLELCADLLHVSHEALIMFPEGTRSSDGSLQNFRNGIGRLVAGTSTPVVPAYIDGAFRAWPRGSVVPMPRRVTVRIGESRRYDGTPPTREGAIAVAADLHRAVLELRECGPSS